MTKTVICATDGSPHAHKAVLHSAMLAKALGGDLILLAVLPHILGRGGPIPQWDPNRAQEALNDGVRDAKAAGVASVNSVLAKGADIADTVIAIAREKHADQIVVGSGGKGAVQRTFLGSVSTGIVHKAHCPVTVVP